MFKIRNKTAKITFGSFLTLIVVTLGLLLTKDSASVSDTFLQVWQTLQGERVSAPDFAALTELTDYAGGEQEVAINGNQPTFTDEELSLAQGSWEEYAPLDRYGRVGAANALLGSELFPTEKRERLTIDPSGWDQLAIGENQWLYNRSHLIGFQLTGENNNERNLMTGTRSLNSPYMLLHENDIIYYLKETGHHVRYRVTPYFKDNELVARGVQLEAQSVEDDQLQLNVFIYNIQEGYTIDYQTGKAQADK